MSRVRRQVSPFAVPLRRAMTDAERKFWYAVRDRRFGDHKFRRQHSIGPYIADFACIAGMLVVELDGSQHGEAVEYDARRTDYMNKLGWKVMRFSNRDLLVNLDGVMATIQWELAARGGGHPHPGPAQ